MSPVFSLQKTDRRPEDHLFPVSCPFLFSYLSANSFVISSHVTPRSTMSTIA